MKAFISSLAILLSFCFISPGCSKDEKNVKPSQVNTLDPSEITRRSAVCGGDILDDGGGNITERGVCYSANGEPTISDSRVTSPGTTGRFSVEIQGLTMNTNYIYKAYSKNEAGVSYGNAKTFATLPFPELTISRVDNIHMTSCQIYGTITLDYPIHEAGFCWSTSEKPTISNDHIETWVANPFSGEITGLQPGTLYHVRAYAINDFGTGYSNDMTFITASNDIPEVITLNVSNYYLNSVTITGNVLNECGSATSRGFIWSTQSGVTFENAIGLVEAGTGLGLFEAEIAPTERNVQYYARAYAENMTGISYGSEISFIYDLPSIHLYYIENFAGNEVTCESFITESGYLDIIAEGYCWSTSPNPDISNTHNNSLHSNPNGLQENTVYYIRAYVQNQVGIAYSNEASFNSGYRYGSQHEGGYVFYNNGSGHGFVCNTSELSSQLYPWGCNNYIGTSASIDASTANTNQIVNTCHNMTDMFAAKFAFDLSVNGYFDWSLPSEDALLKIYENLVVTGLLELPVANRYWSSTEGGYLWAFSVDMTTGQSNAYSRQADAYVLPVRSF